MSSPLKYLYYARANSMICSYSWARLLSLRQMRSGHSQFCFTEPVLAVLFSSSAQILRQVIAAGPERTTLNIWLGYRYYPKPINFRIKIWHSCQVRTDSVRFTKVWARIHLSSWRVLRVSDWVEGPWIQPGETSAELKLKVGSTYCLTMD